MFDNYQKTHSEQLSLVDSTESVVKYVMDMLTFFGVQLYYDPSKDVQEDGKDDMFYYCRVSLLVLLHSCVYLNEYFRI